MFHIFHVRMSQKVKDVLVWNLQHLIFTLKQKYCTFNVPSVPLMKLEAQIPWLYLELVEKPTFLIRNNTSR